MQASDYAAPSPFSGSRPIGMDRKMSEGWAARDEARHQSVLSGMNAIAGLAAAKEEGRLYKKVMQKAEGGGGGIGGAIGGALGGVVGSVVPGIGTGVGGSIGSALGGLFG